MSEKQDNVLLDIRGLKMHFPVRRGLLRRQTGAIHAVDGVDLQVGRGEALGLVGESGCGKSTIGKCVLKLHEPTAGRILYDGADIGPLTGRGLKGYRRRVQAVFQDPYSSLNARMSLGEIVAEPLVVHGIGSAAERRLRVAGLLEKVGIGPECALRYPHEFSGGQRQRIGIARALALRPELIICDEPVSALDVSIQAQVINLLDDLQQEFGLSYLFIAHDLSVVEHVCDRIAVMYLGRIVEVASDRELYADPLHPYTQALMNAIPLPDPSRRRAKLRLSGEVPSPVNPPPGCRFHTRCPLREELCTRSEPPLVEKRTGHSAACHLVGESESG